MKPLTQLLKKQAFAWSDSAQQAFESLKKAMASTPILGLPDFEKPFTVETDACATGVGAVLLQQGHPIPLLESEAKWSLPVRLDFQPLDWPSKRVLAVGS